MRTPLFIALSSLLTLTACGGSSSSPSSPGSNTPPTNNPPANNIDQNSVSSPNTRLEILSASDTPKSGSGQLKVLLTDAPNRQIDVAEVTITDVSVHRAGGAPYSILNEARTLNLLDFQNGVSTLLGDITLEAGRYTQIRLEVSEGWVESEGEGFAVFVPSGVVRINRPLDICADGEVEILLDFDAEKSLRFNPGLNQFRLQPVVNLADVSEQCPGENTDTNPEDESGNYEGPTGWLSLVVPAVDTETFDSLVTSLDDIRVHKSGIGQVSVLAETYNIDLLEADRQIAGETANDAGYTLLIPPVEVPSGSLSQIRLHLQPLIITDTEGRTLTLQLPADQDSESDGLKFFGDVEVCEGALTTVQWNLDLTTDSLNFETNDPVIRLHPVAEPLTIISSCEPMETPASPASP